MSKRPRSSPIQGEEGSSKKMKRVLDSSSSSESEKPAGDTLASKFQKVLDELAAHKHAKPFIKRFDEAKWGLQKYDSVVTNYIDLDIIQKKLNSGSYSTTDSFKNDILLIFNNMFKATKGMTNSDIRKKAKKMNKFADRTIKIVIYGQTLSEDDNGEEEEGEAKNKEVVVQQVAPVASFPVEDQWVQCDACKKWRQVHSSVNAASLPERWECKDNTWNSLFASCSAAEQSHSDNEGGLQGENIVKPIMPVTPVIPEKIQPPIIIEEDSGVVESTIIGVSRELFEKRLGTIWDADRIPFNKRTPKVGDNVVDFYKVYEYVVQQGGFEEICTAANRGRYQGVWIKLFKIINENATQETAGYSSAAFNFKRIYEKFLLKYEKKYFSIARKGAPKGRKKSAFPLTLLDKSNTTPIPPVYPPIHLNTHLSVCLRCKGAEENIHKKSCCLTCDNIVCEKCYKGKEKNIKNSWVCDKCVKERGVSWNNFDICPSCGIKSYNNKEILPLTCTGCQGMFHPGCVSQNNKDGRCLCFRCSIFPVTTQVVLLSRNRTLHVIGL